MPFCFGVTELIFGTAGSADPNFLYFTVVWGDILFVQAVSPSFAQIIATSFGSSTLAERWAILSAGTWPSCMSRHLQSFKNVNEMVNRLENQL